jgi:hypothetical protein
MVTTEAVSPGHDKSLYIGGAMEVIPTSPHVRRIILEPERLSRPSPITPHGPAVSEMRHIRGQPYSAFTLQLIKDLVGGDITSVSQRMNWFETQAMQRAVKQWVHAVQCSGGTRCMGGRGTAATRGVPRVGASEIMGTGAREPSGAMQTGSQRAATRERS